MSKDSVHVFQEASCWRNSTFVCVYKITAYVNVCPTAYICRLKILNQHFVIKNWKPVQKSVDTVDVIKLMGHSSSRIDN